MDNDVLSHRENERHIARFEALCFGLLFLLFIFGIFTFPLLVKFMKSLLDLECKGLGSCVDI